MERMHPQNLWKHPYFILIWNEEVGKICRIFNSVRAGKNNTSTDRKTVGLIMIATVLKDNNNENKPTLSSVKRRKRPHSVTFY